MPSSGFGYAGPVDDESDLRRKLDEALNNSCPGEENCGAVCLARTERDEWKSVAAARGRAHGEAVKRAQQAEAKVAELTDLLALLGRKRDKPELEADKKSAARED